MKKPWGTIYKKLRSRRAQQAYIIIFCLFLLANAATWVAFRTRAYPNTVVAGRSIGNLQKADLPGELDQLGLVPDEIVLIYKDKQTKVTTTELGIQLDAAKTTDAVMQKRSWLPIANFFVKHQVSFATKTDNTKLQAYAEAYTKKHAEKPVNATISLKNEQFSVAPDTFGSSLSPTKAASDIVDQVARGQASVTLHPQQIPASITAASLQQRLSVIKKQQQTKVTVRYQAKVKTFTSAEVAQWYELENSRAELADSNIQAALVGTGAEFGILIKNIAEAVAAAKNAVDQSKPLDFTLIAAPKPTKAFSYCVAVRGVAASYLGELSTKLAATYNDSRGWNLAGQVHLTKAATGCSFTIWLSEASQMPTFGSICDSTWSCRSGNNVVINFTRWQNASPAWNANGGSLADYRAMVINHETGHWFGFYHKNCGGAGQQAPVMQQQSINLQGCKFNPWPLPSERAELKKNLRL